MKWKQVLAVTLVALVVGFIVVHKVGSGALAPGPETVQIEGHCECEDVPPPPQSAGPAPQVPTGSGLPCLVELGGEDREACKAMAPVLAEVAETLAGQVDVVKIDTDLYRQEAIRWQLRLIPTQILLDADGEILWRHEGHIPADELLAEIRKASAETS